MTVKQMNFLDKAITLLMIPFFVFCLVLHLVLKQIGYYEEEE